MPDAIPTINKLPWLLTGLSVISISGALVYLAYNLNWLGLIGSLIISAGLLWWRRADISWPRWSDYKSITASLFDNQRGGSKAWPIVYALAWLASLVWLWLSRTDQAIQSPWQALPPLFFAYYLLLTAAAYHIASRANNYLILGLHYFLSFGVLAIIYTIGYGFDPFVHQAALDKINTAGSITPKTLYYSGQYSLIIISHRLTALPLAWLNKFLVPILAAALLPAVWHRSAARLWPERPTVAALWLLVLPFTFLTITTPQNLAYLLAVAALLLGLSAEQKNDWQLAGLLVLWATLTQPLAGWPTALVLASLFIRQHARAKKEIWYAALLALNAVSLPALLFWSTDSYLDAAAGLINIKQLVTGLAVQIPNYETWLLNFVYLLGRNYLWLIILLAGGGLYWLLTQRGRNWGVYLISFGHSLTMLIAGALTGLIHFRQLIDYNQNDYAQRFLIMAVIFLLPLIITSVYGLNRRARPGWSTAPLLAAIITANLYLSYPHQDNYQDNRGWPVTASDLAAVEWIQQDAAGQDYVVLANQQVSAAALSRFGFAKYYGDVFYYPLPTGAPLYEYYLAMLKQPNQQTVQAAMALAKVKRAYFVVNDYWWAADKIKAEAGLTAARQQSLPQGRDTVFVYTTSND